MVLVRGQDVETFKILCIWVETPIRQTPLPLPRHLCTVVLQKQAGLLRGYVQEDFQHVRDTEIYFQGGRRTRHVFHFMVR